MAGKDKKPEIRFAGFSDAWEQRKFHGLANIRRGLTYNPANVRDNGIRVLRSSNINEDTFMLDDDDVFVELQAVNIEFIKEDDILITAANGSSRLVGKHALIRDVQGKAVHGGFMLAASSDEPEFVNSLMSSSWYKKFIGVYVAGGNGAIGNLNKSDLEDQNVFVPNLLEQQKIGMFFERIDNLIILHQRKYDRLVIVKKSMLEKMFPKDGANVPEIRFAGFTDGWEQRKFGELVTPYTNPVTTPSDGYIRLGIRSHAKGTFHNYVRPGMELETAQMHIVGANNFIVNITFGWEHAVAITDENDAGKLVSHRFPQFSFIEGMVPKYFKYIILDEKFRHHLWLSSPGGAGRNRVLKINEMLEYRIWVTSEGEQKMIADFFLKLDNLTTLQQRRLEELKTIKKSMLEKMFV